MKMTNENAKTWRINRQINLSVFVQLIFLASLIIGSWVNLQRQLDLLQHDVAILIQDNKQFHEKLESLSAKTIEYEYRLQAVEKTITRKIEPQKRF